MRQHNLTLRRCANHLWTFLLVVSTAFVLLPLFLVIIYLFHKGLSSLNIDFFTQLPRPAGEAGGGMLHAILGTFYLVGMGGLIAVPLGVLCGVFLSEFNYGKLPNALRVSVDLLTGVPSIVVGIFAYTLLVVPMKSFSAMAGGVALAIIIFPVVTRSTEEILKLTPFHIREAGLSLGLPRWKVIFFIILPGNFSGLTTGILLAISRAAGETAPLLFTAFGNMYISYSPVRPMASMPVQIYNYAIGPYDDWRNQAWAGSLVLIILVLGLNLTSRAILNRERIAFVLRKYLWKKKRLSL